MKSWNEIRKAATAFSKRWKTAYDEKSQAQSFLKEFFDLFGVDTVTQATFEHRVKFSDGSQGFVDMFWQGRILVEMKSKGKDLDAAYGQAMDYVRALPDPTTLPHAIVVSDFQRFRFYDLTKDNALTEFKLADLRKYVTLFGFMIGAESEEIREQDPVNREAAEKMARLHDALKAIGYSGRELETYLVRLLFCLFAEDTEIFEPNQFSNFIARHTAEDGSDLAIKIAELFQVLNTPPEKRLATRNEIIAAFPYVNGNLFGETLQIPAFSAEMRKALLDCGELDWAKISPAIFGAMFQGVMDKDKRHDLGAHYTSEENILKLIRPLFLDGLREEFDNICLTVGTAKRNKLTAFHDRLASLTFLDPACGCGNFLLVAYRELRKLETEVLVEIARLDKDKSGYLDLTTIRKVDVSHFYGIEIEPFPAEIAKVALYLMDHLCNLDAEKELLGQSFPTIPIKASPHIVCTDALTFDWRELLTVDAIVSIASKGNTSSSSDAMETIASTMSPHFDYIFGNPPFLGFTWMSARQKQDMLALFPKNKNLDFVCGWYKKASDIIQGTDTHCAFVSTNSITQGEQVAPLWKNLNAEIDFAYRTFKWRNEAKHNAAVHCVIIGFSASPRKNKIIFDGGTATPAKHINGYLVDAIDIVVERCNSPRCQVPAMTNGNKPVDGGYLIIEGDAYDDFIMREPNAKPYIKKLIGSRELINRIPRYCLWLKGVLPTVWRKMPLIVERIEGCKKTRLASKDASAQKLADYPTTFRDTRNPQTAIVIPEVSSQTRKYVPMDFIDDSVICTNKIQMIPDATLYHFGVLTSQMHMAWMRAVGGRMKSDYSYSKDIVYNNFIWPITTAEQQARITEAAQTVLEARMIYFDADAHCSLADLYDGTAMPPELVKAHAKLDALVDKAYGRTFANDAERVAHLFNLYADAVKSEKQQKGFAMRFNA